MALSYHERKALLPHGAVSRIAEKHRCAVSKVSDVLGGTARDREIENDLAKLMRTADGGRVTANDAFGPAVKKLHRKGQLAGSVAE